MTTGERRRAFIAWAAYGEDSFEAMDNAIRYANDLESDTKFQDDPLFKKSLFEFENLESFVDWRKQNGFYSQKKIGVAANEKFVMRSTAPTTSGYYNASFNKYEKFLKWLGQGGVVDNAWLEALKERELTGKWPILDKKEIKTGEIPEGVKDGINVGVKVVDVISNSRNRLVFGAPGTGKSYKLNMEACSHKDGAGADVDGLFENADHSETRFERVTFYPTYSYAQFVGTYKPVMKKPEGKHEEEIAYEFVPGPFLRVLVKALNEVSGANGKKKDWCLIIEEINRANAAAVFGDIFQLLDRTSEGVSEYAVAASEDVKKYLAKELSDAGKAALSELAGSTDKLKMPANMYLWATMNSADQGVFPMDTAFKRRWEFEYVGIDESAAACDAWQVVGGGKSYKWNDVRSFINCLLSLNGVNEDKLMGPFFVKAENNLVPAKQFESKVLMYLWEDAARMCRTKLFASILTYSKLVAEWRNKGPAMFSELMKEGTPTGKDGQTKELWKNLFPEPENNIE